MARAYLVITVAPVCLSHVLHVSVQPGARVSAVRAERISECRLPRAALSPTWSLPRPSPAAALCPLRQAAGAAADPRGQREAGGGRGSRGAAA